VVRRASLTIVDARLKQSGTIAAQLFGVGASDPAHVNPLEALHGSTLTLRRYGHLGGIHGCASGGSVSQAMISILESAKIARARPSRLAGRWQPTVRTEERPARRLVERRRSRRYCNVAM
jgi:hypothetical protein